MHGISFSGLLKTLIFNKMTQKHVCEECLRSTFRNTSALLLNKTNAYSRQLVAARLQHRRRPAEKQRKRVLEGGFLNQKPNEKKAAWKIR